MAPGAPGSLVGNETMPAPVRSLRSSAVREFLATEAAGGAVLVVAAGAALVWANSPWPSSYDDVWHTELPLLDLRHWVNDGLMALFFFVVGVEVKRELVVGELSTRRRATLPVVAAAGGMAVPAAIYAAFNAGGPGASGWGVPMATDIAFAVGVLALFGSRIPSGLKVFLLSLAIADDIGAVAVIALFYAGGVHPTLVAVVLGLLVPVRFAERLERRIHPVTSFFVLPLFALANAGVRLDAGALDAPGATRVAGGVVVALVVGKTVGIALAARAAVAMRVGELPEGVSWTHVVGVGALAGIGFTVSLFVAELAFDTEGLRAAAKIGIIVASVAASAVGALVLRAAQPAADDPALADAGPSLPAS
ncbi:MAG TPA: Na+/H+ antiporter NhaA [Acidimicrobiales bacterium]